MHIGIMIQTVTHHQQHRGAADMRFQVEMQIYGKWTVMNYAYSARMAELYAISLRRLPNAAVRIIDADTGAEVTEIN
jgi:hypothetical protein